MAFHSAYVDLLSWETCNLPGLPRLDLHSFWGALPFDFVCYDARPDAPHYEGARGWLCCVCCVSVSVCSRPFDSDGGVCVWAWLCAVCESESVCE